MSASATQAAVLVDELWRCGVRDAVLSPGSRNAPLAFALHRADARGRLRLHVRVDERSAAFLALGLAAASRRLVPVVTTSGTAVANLAPAVLEAGHAGLPVLVLSADRPLHQRGTGASQTIDQPGIFGAAVRFDAVVAQAERRYTPADHRLLAHNALWRSVICRAAHAALGSRGGRPGPVHLDVPFAEPLVADGEPAAPPGRPGTAPWTQVAPDAGGGRSPWTSTGTRW